LGEIVSWLAWQSPVVNEWVRGLDKIRALWILARSLEAGVSMFRAMAMARMSQGNVVAAELLYKAERDVETGDSLSLALEKSNMLTPMEIASIRAGEVSGNLPLSLTALAKMAEESWESRTRKVVGAALMLPYALFLAPWLLLVLALAASF
jgi:type IV pilus assembly protein PilC